METLQVVNGGCDVATTRLARRGAVRQSVRGAIDAGFEIGRIVRVGAVAGCIVGYNIARCGSYAGDHYPLLVQTAYGVAKCRLGELTLI